MFTYVATSNIDIGMVQDGPEMTGDVALYKASI